MRFSPNPNPNTGWVESLHNMYRSYQLGRKSGSLTEDRIMLLVQRGFEFREEG